jgi:hypothetical protein
LYSSKLSTVIEGVGFGGFFEGYCAEVNGERKISLKTREILF